MSKIAAAVFGTGPAGLLACHALMIREVPFVLFGRGEKSQMGGAQFLHRPIPALTREDPTGIIKYVTEGDGGTYRNKVYGELSHVGFVSFDHVPKEQPAWSLQQAYENLWSFYSPLITKVDLDPEIIKELLPDFDLVISAIPLPALCDARQPREDHRPLHTFISQEVKILNDGIVDLPPNTVHYDGTKDHSWYRCSNIFGVRSTEWSANGSHPPVPGLVTVRKPIWSNCDCWPSIMPVGRNGRWEKGVLSHDGFERTMEAIDAMH